MNPNVVDFLNMAVDEIVHAYPDCKYFRNAPVNKVGERFYVEDHESGIGLVLSLNRRVMTIHLHSQDHEGFQKFSGSLPDELSFADSRSRVRSRFGVPSASGGGTTIPFFGPAPEWDRFDREAFSIHLQYSDNLKSVDLISLMCADAVPK